MEYLQASMYKDRLPSAGLYYAQLVDRAKVLKALNTPKLGDSLLKADGTPWMADLQHMAPKLNWDDLTQTAALPLGSWLKTDPWDDKVHMLNAKRYAPMNARDKMPFEVTPIFYKLQRYDYTFHRLTPYGKVLVGLGNRQLPHRTSTFVLAYGGGVDYRLTRRFTLRCASTSSTSSGPCRARIRHYL
jgi:hypothetical protein